MRVLNNRLAALMDRARLLERLNAKMKVTLTKDVVDQRRVVRMEVGRADVYSCGYDPRLPIGYLLLETAGVATGGEMTQELYTGTVTDT